MTVRSVRSSVQSTPADWCRDIVVAYHGDIDRGHATTAIGYFADDALFEAGGRQLRGRDAILGFLADRERRADRHTVHVIANTITSQTLSEGGEPAEISVSALVLLHVRGADGGYALERVLDTVHLFRPTQDGWKIVARQSAPLPGPVPSA
jgi:ketosteroid isomerase-like protein